MEKIYEMVRYRDDMGQTIKINNGYFNGKLLSFKYGHIRSTNTAIIEKDLIRITKKIKNIKEYLKF